jgi:HAD superfamily hydrolase (TIGR01509 family)|tara:strand:- start:225 stop:905 length:681 start_codon:yes stop_codon:yes gene_type:complete
MFLKVNRSFLDISHVEAAIFDMDGTLVESEHIWAEAKQDIAQCAGKNITDDELKQYIGRGLNDFIDEVLEPTTLKQRTELNQKIKENVLKDYGYKIRVIDGAVDILNAFSSAGIRIAICSSGPLQAIENSLLALNVTELVEVIVSGETLSMGKPNPLPYLHTLEKLDVEARNAIVFEDTISGLKSATAAGITTIVVGNYSDDPIFSSATLIDPLLSNFYLSSRAGN